MPSLRAASTRPWPAMMPFLPSTNTGLVQPNSLRLAQITLIGASLCDRGLLAYGTKPAMGRSKTCLSLLLTGKIGDLARRGVDLVFVGIFAQVLCGRFFGDGAALAQFGHALRERLDGSFERSRLNLL